MKFSADCIESSRRQGQVVIGLSDGQMTPPLRSSVRVKLRADLPPRLRRPSPLALYLQVPESSRCFEYHDAREHAPRSNSKAFYEPSASAITYFSFFRTAVFTSSDSR